MNIFTEVFVDFKSLFLILTLFTNTKCTDSFDVIILQTFNADGPPEIKILLMLFVSQTGISDFDLLISFFKNCPTNAM